MALTGIEKDVDLEFLDEHFSGKRVQLWLWHFVAANNPYFQSLTIGPDNKNGLGAYLRRYSYAFDQARVQKGAGFVPDVDFSWVDNGQLQNNFLRKYFLDYFGVHSPWIHPSLSGRQWMVTFVDCLSNDLAWKVRFVQNARLAWASHLCQNRIFGWFKDKEENKRCLFAWEWLVRNKLTFTWGRIQFQKHEDLLAFFDASSLTQSDKKLMVLEIKRAWSQQLYRQNLKGKKQFNFMLSDDAIACLVDLSNKHQKSKAKVIEDLIKGEAMKGVYLVEEKGDASAF